MRSNLLEYLGVLRFDIISNFQFYEIFGIQIDALSFQLHPNEYKTCTEFNSTAIYYVENTHKPRHFLS